jgi:hypothetical protein
MGVVCGIIASAVCLFAGIWILKHTGFKKDDVLATGIGVYFVGKAFFLGPMLIITALRK